MNFTTAVMSTMASDIAPPEALIHHFFFQPCSLWMVWYLAIPKPARVKPVNTPRE